MNSESTFTQVRPYIAGPTAKRAHEEIKRVKMAWGPFGTAKTTWLCWRAILMAAEAAKAGIGLRALIVRDTFRNLQDTTLKTWLEWFPHPQVGILRQHQSTADFSFWLGGQKHEVAFRHGQTAQDASQFLSAEYGFIGLEEVVPAYTPSGLVSPGIAEEVFNMAIPRLRQTGIDEPELSITCQPPLPSHWAYRRIINRTEAELKALKWAHYFFSQEENRKNLRPGYYEELERSYAGDDVMIKRFVRGEIVQIFPGLPIFQKDFSYARHVRDELFPILSRGFILGWDNPPAPACISTQIDAKGRWLWLKEFQGGYSGDRLVEDIGMVKFSDYVYTVLRTDFPGIGYQSQYGDPACQSPSTTDETTAAQIVQSRFSLPFIPGLSPITPRIESIRNRLNDTIDGEPALLISKSGCPIAIEALMGGYRYGLKTDSSALRGYSPVKDLYSNIIDAAGYIGSKLFWRGVIDRREEARKTKHEPTVDSEMMGW